MNLGKPCNDQEAACRDGHSATPFYDISIEDLDVH